MKIDQNLRLTQNARNLRKNMTDEERKLWFMALKEFPVKFRRQQVIGNYIVDFYCDKAKLTVELDGSQHYEVEGQAKDTERTKYIESQGIKVIRFTNAEVNESFRVVCDAIYAEVQERLPLCLTRCAPSASPPEGATRPDSKSLLPPRE